jgi:hypothetical protein
MQAPAAPLPPAAAPVRAARLLRRLVSLYGRFSGAVQPAPSRSQPLDRAVYGAAQPLLGLRVLLGDRELLAEALIPVAWLAGFCSLVPSLQGDPLFSVAWVVTFYKTFALLAPVPSIIFSRHYARFAALVRFRLGLGTFGPRELPIPEAIRRAAKQAVLTAVAMAPFVLLLDHLPLGGYLSGGLLALWGLQCVVADAFDDANVLPPGRNLAQVEAESLAHNQSPWFVRLFGHLAVRLPGQLGPVKRATGAFARFLDWLARPWREEFALSEKNPEVSLGFALATAGLLATPVLNLLFRPITIAGATHLMAQLELQEQEDAVSRDRSTSAAARPDSPALPVSNVAVTQPLLPSP